MKYRTIDIVVTVLFLAGGCDDSLKQALEDVRAGAPAFCNDYCERENACSWGESDGVEKTMDDRASSAAIHRCVLECAYFAAHGAYAYDPYNATATARHYVEHVPASKLKNTVRCLVELGVYSCEDQEVVPPVYLLRPLTESKCQLADDCLFDIEADFELSWDGSEEGGCLAEGDEVIEAPYFWLVP
jgi:hypothetical protein